jgi:uncharacterized protein (TIGR03000 family)
VYVQPAPHAAPAEKPAKPEQTSERARVLVQLPEGAKLSVDGQPIQLTSGQRSFVTPPLDRGRDYSYTLRGEVVRNGETVTQTQRVVFRAGEVARVRFDELSEDRPAPARVVVKLPGDAKLYVDGTLIPLTSATRSFETPKLQPNQLYYYTVKAEVVRDGKTRSDSKRVVLEAGKQASVDFGDLEVVQAASR